LLLQINAIRAAVSLMTKENLKSVSLSSVTLYHMEQYFGEIHQAPGNYFTSRGTLLE